MRTSSKYRLFPNYGYADPSPPSSLRSGHLDIKDAQCAKKMMGVKFHIAFIDACLIKRYYDACDCTCKPRLGFTTRLGKNRRETGVSQHNGGLIEGPP